MKSDTTRTYKILQQKYRVWIDHVFCVDLYVSYTPNRTLAQIHTHLPSRWLSLPSVLSLSRALSRCLSRSLSCSRSLSRAHAKSISLARCISVVFFFFFFFALSLSHARREHARVLSFSLARTLSLSCSLFLVRVRCLSSEHTNRFE